VHFPRLPDWLVYAAVVTALLFAAIGRRERADAPPPPPSPQIQGDEALGSASTLDPEVVVNAPEAGGPRSGTAFSVDQSGVWLTARHVVEGCARAAVVVAEGRGIAARVQIDPRSEAALLITNGGVAGLPTALSEPLKRGMRAFHPGFPQAEPGEATSRLLGRETLVVRGRGARSEPVLVWAETGRTDGLEGTLAGLSGAPALDAAGRVVGVTIAEAPRRGRIYTTAPEMVTDTLRTSTRHPEAGAAVEAITPENYGRIADDLRRTLRVAQVVCLERI
jgi:S1-C subfamily serine protease